MSPYSSVGTTPQLTSKVCPPSFFGLFTFFLATKPLKLGTVNTFRTAQTHSLARDNYNKIGPLFAGVHQCMSVKQGYS